LTTVKSFDTAPNVIGQEDNRYMKSSKSQPVANVIKLFTAVSYEKSQLVAVRLYMKTVATDYL